MRLSRHTKRVLFLSYTCMLCGLVVILAMIVMMTRSPDKKAVEYQQLAYHYMQEMSETSLSPDNRLIIMREAQDLFAKALQLAPQNQVLWQDYAIVLTRYQALLKDQPSFSFGSSDLSDTVREKESIAHYVSSF